MKSCHSRADWLATVRSGAVATLIALSACAGSDRPDSVGAGPNPAGAADGGESNSQIAAGRFDPEAAADLLAAAQAAEAGGRTQQALELYRRSGLAWPDTVAAWKGLAELADRTDRPEEANAARFMAERVQLYPSDSLFVQRDVARALRSYVAAEASDPDRNGQQLQYAAQLADFYDARYAERGVYQTLDPYFNLEPGDYPTAIITGIAGAAYVGTLAAGN